MLTLKVQTHAETPGNPRKPRGNPLQTHAETPRKPLALPLHTHPQQPSWTTRNTREALPEPPPKPCVTNGNIIATTVTTTIFF